jgi:hypothetical protein
MKGMRDEPNNLATHPPARFAAVNAVHSSGNGVHIPATAVHTSWLPL